MALSRREFFRVLGAGTALMALPSCLWTQTTQKTNFVFFLVDDLGWADVGFNGSKFYETPNIDRLAQQGMRFTDAYAASPVCSPTRASILSGKYPARMQTTDWFGAPQPDTIYSDPTMMFKLLKPAPYVEHLPLSEITIAEAMKACGYKTFIAGKWHCGDEGFYPEDQGFDINKGGWEAGSPVGGYFAPYVNPRLEQGPEGEYLTDRLAAETVSFINQNRDEPFLVYLSFYAVHIPLQAKQDMIQKYKIKARKLGWPCQFTLKDGCLVRQVQGNATYAAMIESVDQAVGRVLDTLDELGLAENTVIIFMSDNGGLSTAEGWPTSNLPLRAGKGWLYEGGVREPMIIKWPNVTTPSSTCRTPVTSTDFYPTILEMAGLPLMPQQHMDGESLVPLLKQSGTLKRDAIFWHYPHYGNQGGQPAAAVRAGDWKLIEFFEDGRLELYNLKDDIGEGHNRAKEMPEKVAELQTTLHQWFITVDAQMPGPNMLNIINWFKQGKP